jgi:hypothetical protein
LITALSTALILVADAHAQTGAAPMSDAELERHRHDWDWLAGNWNVRHRRLRERLTGNTEWQEFDGTCRMVQTLNGFGNMDDNWLDLPAGAYRAMGIRAFNPDTRLWSIWWFDERSQTIDPPVRGGFENGVGTFTGDDTLRGQPIIVRFRWSEIGANSARWEQAFSPDGGATWEVNWVMHFTRV